MRRRSLLKALGGTAIGAAASTPAPKPASGRIRLAIRTVAYQGYPMAEAARRIRQAGFEGVQLGLRFADARLDLAAPDWGFARRARETFGEAGLRVAGLDGYTNLVHPDPAARERGLRGLALLLEHAGEFGTRVVATESGTFRPGQRWNPHPENPAAGWKLFVETLEILLDSAETGDSLLALEGSIIQYIGTVEAVRRLLETVPSPRLKILWDPSNYFDETRLERMTELLRAMSETFGAHVVLCHAKDVRPAPDGKVEWVAAGEGRLDYAEFFRLLDGLGREIFVALEYVREPEAGRVKRYVEGFL